jgi:hypothetical protein
LRSEIPSFGGRESESTRKRVENKQRNNNEVKNFIFFDFSVLSSHLLFLFTSLPRKFKQKIPRNSYKLQRTKLK